MLLLRSVAGPACCRSSARSSRTTSWADWGRCAETGLAGGLHAINYEIVSADSASALRSGTVLLMTYIGGVGHFIGPVIGAAVLTWLQASLSGYTSAWLLYLGVFFMLVIVFARLFREGLWGLLRAGYARIVAGPAEVLAK